MGTQGIGARAGIAVAVAVTCGLASPARAQRVVVSAPATAVSDGQSTIAVTVTVEPAAVAERAQSVTLRADYGSVGPARAIAGGAAFEVRAPALIAARRLTLTATARIRGRTYSGQHVIEMSPPPVDAPEVSSGGAFDLRGPAFVQLPRRGPVSLSIRKPAGAPPAIYASAGEVSAWQPDGPDRVRVTYTAPDRSQPGVAVVAVASADRARWDWLAIPLHAVSTLALNGEPGASVTARVGARVLGPVRTDRRGRASLPMSVPPGVRAAEISATDIHGNTRQSRVEIKTAPLHRALMVCPEASASALVFATDLAAGPATGLTSGQGNGGQGNGGQENGHAGGSKRGRGQRTSGVLHVTAEPGDVSAVRELAPGVYAVTYAAPDGAVGGQPLAMRAVLDGDAASTAACAGDIPGEPPASLAVTTSAPAYTAESGAPVRVAVTPRYTGELPPAIVPVALSVDIGTLSPSERGDDGVIRAVWTLPDGFDGRAVATVTARAVAAGGQAITARAQLALRPGPITRLALSPGRRSLRADGRASTAIAITARDAHGNGVPGARLRVRGVEGGAIGAVTEGDRPGVYEVRYTAPRSHDAVTEHVTVVDDGSGVQAYDTVSLLPVPRRAHLAVRAGYLTNGGKVAGPLVTVEAGIRLFTGPVDVTAGAEVGVYTSARTDVAGPQMEAVDTAVTAAPVQLRVAMSRDLGRVTPYVSGAAGTLVTSVRVDAASAAPIRIGDAFLAVSGAIGARVALRSRHRLVVELGYLRSMIDEGGLAGNLGGYHISAGYRLGL